jgi:DNA-directed RNA polymerase specialized sigma24 family protein
MVVAAGDTDERPGSAESRGIRSSIRHVRRAGAGAKMGINSVSAGSVREPRELDPPSLLLQELITVCWEETAKFRRNEPYRDDVCRELLRRALCLRDEQAWEAIVAIYRGMVLAWIRQHPAHVVCDEEEDRLNGAFERFWRAVGPDRFPLFTSTASLLGYLRTCVHSVLLDEVRRGRGVQLESLEELASAGREPVMPIGSPEALVVDQLTTYELWSMIGKELTDESEWLATYLSFGLDMKPSELQERYPDRYPTVADVYRVKRNVLERLRRSSGIRTFLHSTSATLVAAGEDGRRRGSRTDGHQSRRPLRDVLRRRTAA